jgi:hypothetical protein
MTHFALTDQAYSGDATARALTLRARMSETP